MIIESLDPHYRTSIAIAYLLLSSVKLDISEEREILLGTT
jgi:hypothetical protein